MNRVVRPLGHVRATQPLKGLFTCRAVTYGTVDMMGSVWAPGVFDESLDRELPPACLHHSWTMPVGRAIAWRPTPEGPELDVRLDIHDDVPMARQALAQLASGTLRDVSVGFSNADRRAPTAEERRRLPGVQEVITRADLDEISIVLHGAVEGAEVLAVRGRRSRVARVHTRMAPPPARPKERWVRRPSAPLTAAEEQEWQDWHDVQAARR